MSYINSEYEFYGKSLLKRLQTSEVKKIKYNSHFKN